MPTDRGWLNKLNGGDSNYGNKSVAVISTSDNRFEDGRELGNYFSWVKWSQPSAEAFRQACLAKESRLTQTNPDLPQIFITKIDVTNSKFLSSFSVEFNQQYNCLIGGRGTGKSTILEYLRWVLCDQTIVAGEIDGLTELEKRRKILIEKTLTQFQGEVRVTFVLNGVHHIVKRNSVSDEIMLKIDSAEFQRVNEEEIRRILPIQAYSQKQLSSVGVTADELKRFIQSPISNEIGNLDFELRDNIQHTRTTYLDVLRKRTILKENDQFILEITSLRNQVHNLRQSLSGISPEDQAIVSRKPTIDTEANFVSGVQRELNTVRTKVGELESALANLPEPFPSNATFENNELLNSLHLAKNNKVQAIKDLITQIKQALLTENSAEVRNLVDRWHQLKTGFDILYETAKSRTTSNQQQITEIQRIEERVNGLQNSINDRTDTLRNLGDPQAEFDSLRVEYWRLLREKGRMLDQQAKKFEQLSGGQIKVEVLKNLDVAKLKFELARILQGTRIQNDKIQAISDSVAGAEQPLEEWQALLSELKILVEYKSTSDGSNPFPLTPKLSHLNLNTNNLAKVSEVLTTDNWLTLATMSIEFSPDFKYSTNNEMGDELPFSDASAGQQATALLTVLLNQPGAPLIIDQPEDDIDNRAIDDIIRSIWEAKKHRQLIFTSHNANLVVNGDAELVVCCDYRESGNQTRGFIKAEGAIDSKSVKDEITSVMEGGEKAFKLRKDKYGF